MTSPEIKDYKDNIYDEKKHGKFGGTITLFGYTSFSLKKNTAMSFMWENATSGHHKVLFHLKWGRGGFNHYSLNAGAYDHEEEVLLMDGCKVMVTSVSEVCDEQG